MRMECRRGTATTNQKTTKQNLGKGKGFRVKEVVEEEEKWAEGGWMDERRRGRREKRGRRSGPTSRKTEEKNRGTENYSTTCKLYTPNETKAKKRKFRMAEAAALLRLLFHIIAFFSVYSPSSKLPMELSTQRAPAFHPSADQSAPPQRNNDVFLSFSDDKISTVNVSLSERRIELSNNMDYITTEPAASSSSPSTHQWKYGVFLSFRGADTPVSFAIHLYDSLVNRGINTFIDDDELRRGELRISVVVFSENYASSRWCLDELVKILECKKSQQQIVLPIYYDVDPSHVRDQTGTFGEAFAGLAYQYKDDEKKVMRWKTALTEAGNLSAMVFNKDWSESKFIHEITEEISRLLKHADLTYETDCLVGVDSRISEMNDLAQHRLNEAESPEKVLEDEEDQRGPNEVGSLVSVAVNSEANEANGVPETNEGSTGGEETSPENQNEEPREEPGPREEPDPADNDTGKQKDPPRNPSGTGMEPPEEPDPADNGTGKQKGFRDWIILIITFFLDIISAICDQFSSSEKPIFAVIGMVLAIVALVICASELICKAIQREFEFGRCRMCLWWFFCPKTERLFGTLPDLFGLISGISQCASSIVQCVCVLLRKDNPFKVNLLPTTFLICVGGSKLFEDCKRCTKYSWSRSPRRENLAESQDSGKRTPSSKRTSVSGSVEGGRVSVSSNLLTQSSNIQTVGNSNEISAEGAFESSGDERHILASEIKAVELVLSGGRRVEIGPRRRRQLNWTSVSGSVEGGRVSVPSNLLTQSSYIRTVGNSNEISAEGAFESSGDEKPFSASEINAVELELGTIFLSRGKIGS